VLSNPTAGQSPEPPGSPPFSGTGRPGPRAASRGGGLRGLAASSRPQRTSECPVGGRREGRPAWYSTCKAHVPTVLP